ncbi:hypothetical protein [Streptomyces avermitilis]|uniref:hypothetical protein n=1 Tax=Streptomyces avermitilis TaxID=33903 RepID=UPI00368C2294
MRPERSPGGSRVRLPFRDALPGLAFLVHREQLLGHRGLLVRHDVVHVAAAG